MLTFLPLVRTLGANLLQSPSLPHGGAFFSPHSLQSMVTGDMIRPLLCVIQDCCAFWMLHFFCATRSRADQLLTHLTHHILNTAAEIQQEDKWGFRVRSSATSRAGVVVVGCANTAANTWSDSVSKPQTKIEF